MSSRSIFVATISATMICLCASGCASRDLTDHSAVAFDLSPDGKQIVFSSSEGDLFLLDLDTKHVDQLTNTNALETSPAFSPDGAAIAYASAAPNHETSHIFRLTLGNKQVEQLTEDENVYDSSPSHSADGSRIVFSRAHRYRTYSMGGMTWDDWDLYIMDVDGSNVSRVTNQEYRGITPPHFGVDGKTIFFSSRIKRQVSSRYSAIFKVSIAEGQPPENLTPDDNNTGCAALGSAPSVSPDGTKIVFISDRITKYEYDLFVMNLDGSNPTPLNLTGISKYNAIPRFSPSGKEVFFLAESEKNANSQPLFSLWAADATGQNPYRIADKGLFNEPLQWGPREEGSRGTEKGLEVID